MIGNPFSRSLWAAVFALAIANLLQAEESDIINAAGCMDGKYLIHTVRVERPDLYLCLEDRREGLESAGFALAVQTPLLTAGTLTRAGLLRVCAAPLDGFSDNSPEDQDSPVQYRSDASRTPLTGLYISPATSAGGLFVFPFGTAPSAGIYGSLAMSSLLKLTVCLPSGNVPAPLPVMPGSPTGRCCLHRRLSIQRVGACTLVLLEDSA